MRLAESAVEKYERLRPHLNERQRRLVLGAEAGQLGRGGIKAMAAATGVHPDTISRGVREVAEESGTQGRIRVAGAGRKPVTETDPGIEAALDALVDPGTRGDPMSPPASPSYPSTVKRRSWSGISRTPGANTSPPEHPGGSTSTTSRTRTWARPSRTGSTTS